MSKMSGALVFGLSLIIVTAMGTYASGLEAWCSGQEERLRQPCPAFVELQGRWMAEGAREDVRAIAAADAK
ncbi:MAG: hypothetical protein AB1716_02210 [Planctomycetota bacterium]